MRFYVSRGEPETIRIETQSGKKGRSFDATLLTWIKGDAFLPSTGSGKAHRPVWMTYVTTAQTHRPFTLNLTSGAIAYVCNNRKRSDSFQILKTGGYVHHSRAMAGGIVTSVYLAAPFARDAGMVDPEHVAFVVLHAEAYYAHVGAMFTDAQVELAVAILDKKTRATTRHLTLRDLREEDEDDVAEREAQAAENRAKARLALAEAVTFTGYLDRRTRFPLVTDPVFALRLLVACTECGIVQWGRYPRQNGAHFAYEEYRNADLGLAPSIAMYTSHDNYGMVLAEEVRKWHA